MVKREIWYDMRMVALEEQNNIMNLVLNKNYDRLVVNHGFRSEQTLPKRTSLVVHVEQMDQLDSVEDAIVLSEDLDILESAKSRGLKTALFRMIQTKEDLDFIYKKGEFYNFVAVYFYETTNIPLELLIAGFQKKGCTLLKFVHSAQEAEIVFGVMEKGSDGVILNAADIGEIQSMSLLAEKEMQTHLELEAGTVTGISHIGKGCRVCIDTTSILDNNEGMLIGSTSMGGILVSSETHHLPYMELRPFRVNAGAVHSYTYAFEHTRYLTELEAGTPIMAVNTEGRCREVYVGRAKTEIRPLLKIDVVSEKGQHINVIVQDDWHIRILGADNVVYNASEIKPGDKLLAYFCDGGRHVGLKIDEYLEEK